MRHSYATVLRAPHARPLFLAALLGRLSYAMGPLALVLFMHDATGSFALAGAAAAATGLITGVFAPLRGRYVDRSGQRRVLLPLATLYAAAFVGVLLVAGAGTWGAVIAVIFAGVAGAAAPPLSASMRVLWASLVGHGPKLQTAYALDAVLEEIVYTMGPLIAAGLAAAFEPAAALATVAGLALVGTILFTASPASRNWVPSQTKKAGWAGAMTGGGIRVLVASLLGVGATIGILDITVIAAARQAGSAPLGGVLLAAMSAGAAVGGLWYGSRAWRRPTGQRFVVILALLALTCAALPFTESLVALGAAVTAVGLLLSPLESSAYVLAAELAPPGTMTESATWVSTAYNVTGAAGVALAGTLVGGPGVSLTLAIAWACTTGALLVAAAGRGVLRRVPSVDRSG